jgi:hypothetical protein
MFLNIATNLYLSVTFDDHEETKRSQTECYFRMMMKNCKTVKNSYFLEDLFIFSNHNQLTLWRHCSIDAIIILEIFSKTGFF